MFISPKQIIMIFRSVSTELCAFLQKFLLRRRIRPEELAEIEEITRLLLGKCRRRGANRCVRSHRDLPVILRKNEHIRPENRWNAWRRIANHRPVIIQPNRVGFDAAAMQPRGCHRRAALYRNIEPRGRYRPECDE